MSFVWPTFLHFLTCNPLIFITTQLPALQINKDALFDYAVDRHLGYFFFPHYLQCITSNFIAKLKLFFPILFIPAGVPVIPHPCQHLFWGLNEAVSSVAGPVYSQDPQKSRRQSLGQKAQYIWESKHCFKVLCWFPKLYNK